MQGTEPQEYKSTGPTLVSCIRDCPTNIQLDRYQQRPSELWASRTCPYPVETTACYICATPFICLVIWKTRAPAAMLAGCFGVCFDRLVVGRRKVEKCVFGPWILMGRGSGLLRLIQKMSRAMEDCPDCPFSWQSRDFSEVAVVLLQRSINRRSFAGSATKAPALTHSGLCACAALYALHVPLGTSHCGLELAKPSQCTKIQRALIQCFLLHLHTYLGSHKSKYH